jgi:hypothetical protein
VDERAGAREVPQVQNGKIPEGQGLTPRYQYECGHCRFNWCCGPTCWCLFRGKLPEPPVERAREVERTQREWEEERKATRA